MFRDSGIRGPGGVRLCPLCQISGLWCAGSTPTINPNGGVTCSLWRLVFGPHSLVHFFMVAIRRFPLLSSASLVNGQAEGMKIRVNLRETPSLVLVGVVHEGVPHAFFFCFGWESTLRAALAGTEETARPEPGPLWERTTLPAHRP